jgi:hypothetical protein
MFTVSPFFTLWISSMIFRPFSPSALQQAASSSATAMAVCLATLIFSFNSVALLIAFNCLLTAHSRLMAVGLVA